MNSDTRRMMIVVLVVFAALATTYSFVTRLKWAPDEPAHFIYIRSLAVDREFPEISHVNTPHEESDSTHEGHQPPLYYILMAIPFALLKALGTSTDTIWRVLRLLGIPIGLAWMWAVFALAREYFQRDKAALAATALVALIPMSSFMAGVINNEVLIALLFTMAMLPILRYFRTGKQTIRESLYLGALMGFAILAKAQGLVLVAMFLLASLAVCRREHYSNYRPVLRATGIALGTMILIGGWWYLRNWLVYDTLMPRSLDAPVLTSIDGAIADPVTFARLVGDMFAAGFVYFFTPFWLVWKFTNGPMPIFVGLVTLTIAAVIGFIIRVRRGGVDTRSAAFLLLAPVLMWLGWLRYVLFVDKLAMIQGRLLLSAAAVLGILAIVGAEGLFKSHRAKWIGAIVGCALMLTVNAWVIACAVKLYG
jgi:hypothetical protein